MAIKSSEKDLVALLLLSDGKYSVSEDGKVFSENYQGWTGRREELRQKTSPKGYRYVTFRVDGKKSYFLVHRLVALSYLGLPKTTMQINHRNGIKHDNRIENLEWVTAAENLSHARDTGLVNTPKGAEHYKATLSAEQVAEIILLLDEGKGQREIERLYGVGRGVVGAIKSGKSWKHIKRG